MRINAASGGPLESRARRTNKEMRPYRVDRVSGVELDTQGQQSPIGRSWASVRWVRGSSPRRGPFGMRIRTC